MATPSAQLDRMTNALVPSLSRSLAEQFNVFRVMHHGTHEKQLSNVFAWLLRIAGTHGLGDGFQRLFTNRVNASSQVKLPDSGYRVAQEVDTSGAAVLGKDIADIVLTSATATIVVENFESSDGHGHDYHHYLEHGQAGGKHCVVVLLCVRRESHRQVGGWENAVVVTYAELLDDLQHHIAGNVAWQRANPQPLFFINQLIDHFVEGAGAVSIEDRISFIQSMCETGESARYGYRPQEAAAQEFADLIAHHAKRQFEEGRATLGEVKRALKSYAGSNLMQQLNSTLNSRDITTGHVIGVQARWVGQWEWSVLLERAENEPLLFLHFGPTAVVRNNQAATPLSDPDYTKVFVMRQIHGDDVGRLVQTDVGLDEVLSGLSHDDNRLRDALLSTLVPG